MKDPKGLSMERWDKRAFPSRWQEVIYDRSNTYVSLSYYAISEVFGNEAEYQESAVSTLNLWRNYC